VQKAEFLNVRVTVRTVTAGFSKAKFAISAVKTIGYTVSIMTKEESGLPAFCNAAKPELPTHTEATRYVI